MSDRKKTKRIIAITLVVVGLAVLGSIRWMRREGYFGVETYKPDVQYFIRGSRDNKDVCFTFDDGPHVAGAPLILDELKKEGIHATFFVVGARVKLHPELVKRMIDEGNEVGNHTQDHLRLDKLPIEKVRAEIENCAINIERACGRRPALLRPPGMQFNHEVLVLATKMGYTTVGWNVGAGDFTPTTTKKMTQAMINESNATPDQVADRVLTHIKPGEIILLHDNPVTAKALPRIFETLKKMGYQIKTVTQMLAELNPPVIIDPDPPFVPATPKKLPTS